MGRHRVRGFLGWRHPVRKVRRKATRSLYRSLTPTRHRRRPRAGGGRRHAIATQRQVPATPANPAVNGFCLLSGLGCVGAIIATAAGAAAALGWGIFGAGIVLGIVLMANFALKSRARTAPPKRTQETSMPTQHPANMEVFDAEIRRLGALIDLMTAEIRAAIQGPQMPTPAFRAARQRFFYVTDEWQVIGARLQAGIPPSEMAGFSSTFWAAAAALENSIAEMRSSIL